jgi:hypothetical protein
VRQAKRQKHQAFFLAVLFLAALLVVFFAEDLALGLAPADLAAFFAMFKAPNKRKANFNLYQLKKRRNKMQE